MDKLVCGEVLAKYGIVDEQGTSSRRFEVGDATYDFVQVDLGVRTCCGVSDYYCEIWDVTSSEGVLFAAEIFDTELQSNFDVGCAPSDVSCDWPGYSHPLVSDPEFIHFAKDGTEGFMGYCRNWLSIAQGRGFLPSEP